MPGCAAALQRLTLILDAADTTPESVALLPDRSSRILGAAAAEILHAPAEQDEGDGETPPDPDEGLRRFVEAITSAGARERDSGWLGGIREYTPGAGPVSSSRFL